MNVETLEFGRVIVITDEGDIPLGPDDTIKAGSRADTMPIPRNANAGGWKSLRTNKGGGSGPVRPPRSGWV